MPGITHPQLLNLPTELTTDRLVVRAYRAGDGTDLHACLQRSLDHLAPWMPWVDPKQTVDQAEVYARDMQADWMARKQFVVQVRRRSDDHFVGAMGLHQPKWSLPSFMMGWWIAADAIGMGYATEAAGALMNFAFDHLHAVRVWAMCDELNPASERVMQKIGLRKEGLVHCDDRNVKGELRNSWLYARTITPN